MRINMLDNLKVMNPVAVLTLIDSPKLQNFVQEKALSVIAHQSDSEIIVSSEDDMLVLKDAASVLPPFADKWVVIFDGDKAPIKGLGSLIKKTRQTCYYYIYCKEYKNYRQILQTLKTSGMSYFDLYLQYFSHREFNYIRACTETEKTTELSSKLQTYIINNYSKNVEGIMTLIEKMNEGYEINKRTDIEAVCGLPDIHTDDYVLKLLTFEWSNKAKGLKTQVKNQTNLIYNMGESLGYDTLYNYINTSFTTLINTKGMMLSNIINPYNPISGLTALENLDIREQQRIKKQLNSVATIESIPYSKILDYYSIFKTKRWSDGLDALNFLYAIIYRETKQKILLK